MAKMRAATRVRRTRDLVRKVAPTVIYPYKGMGFEAARKETARTIKHMRSRPLNTLKSKRDQSLAKKLRRSK